MTRWMTRPWQTPGPSPAAARSAVRSPGPPRAHAAPRRSCRGRAALGHLDPLVEGFLGVAVDDPNRLLSQDRACVHFENGQVHRAAGLADSGRQGVAHGMPTGKRWEERRVRVEDAPREGAVYGLGQQRSEAGHRHQVDLVVDQRLGHDCAVGVAVESGTEAPVRRARDQLGGHAVCRGDVQTGALPVGEHDGDGKAGLEHGLEDRPRPRDENGQTHGVNLVKRAPGSRRRQPGRRREPSCSLGEIDRLALL